MGATFVIDVETGSTRKNLEAVTAAFEAGKISSKEYAAAVLAAAKEIGKFEAANKLAGMSLKQIGGDLFKANTMLGAYVSATNQAEVSLKKFAAASNIRTAFADRAAVELYNTELKKSIQLQGQINALEKEEYVAIVKSNAALQAQNALRKQAVGMTKLDMMGEQTMAIKNAEGYSSAMKTAALVQMGLASSLKSTEAQAARTHATMKAGSQAFTAYGSAIRGIAGSMGALWMSYGQIIPLMTAFAAAAGVKQVYSLGAEFEYTAKYIDTLGRYSGKTTKEVGELKEELLAVSDTRHSINELALGIKEFSKAGVDVTTSLQDIGEMSRFASLAEMDLTESTKIVIGQANAFGESYSDAANMIASAAMSSATDIGEMATAMSQTTELGSVAKVEFNEVAAALAVLANNGIRGSKAGTSLRTSMMRLLNPTADVKRMIEGLNLNWSAFSDDGKIKSLRAVFTELKRATDQAGLTDKELSELQHKLFGLRSLKGGANVFSAVPDQLEDMYQAIMKSKEGTTFLKQATDDLASTVEVKWDKVKVAFSDSATLAMDNSEAFGEFLEAMEKVASSDGFRTFLETSITSMSSFLAGLVVTTEQFGKLLEKANSWAGRKRDLPDLQEQDYAEQRRQSNIADGKALAARKAEEQLVLEGASVQQKLIEEREKLRELLISSGQQGAATPSDSWLAHVGTIKPMALPSSASQAPVTDIWLARDKGMASATRSAEEYLETLEKIGAARASIDDKMFALGGSGGSAYEQYQHAVEAANRQVAKMLEQNAELGDDPGMAALTSDTVAYGEALKAVAADKFELEKSKSFASLGKELSEFIKDSAEPLPTLERGLAQIDAAVAGLKAKVSAEAIRLFGSDSEENIAKVEAGMGIVISRIEEAADKQQDMFSDKIISAWESDIADLAKEYGNLSRHEEAVLAVTSKFSKKQEELNDAISQGNPEAIRFSNALKQIEANALLTDTAILKTSDSIRNGLVAAIVDFNKEAATMGELSYAAFNNIASGIKGASSAGFSHLFFGDDAVKDLKSSYRESLAGLEEQYHREQELNKKSLDEGKITYEEYQQSLSELHDKYEEDRYDTSNQYQKDLQKVQKSSWEVFYESLKTSVKDSLVESVSTYATDTVIGWGSSLLGGILGMDMSSLTGQAPTGAQGSEFHVIVENWEGAGIAGALSGLEIEAGTGAVAGSKTGVMAWISQYLGPEVAEAVKMVGGAVGVAGGAYGMYSGARDVSGGNLGAGALKMGTGAVSAYKGAVSLGILEEGTATKIGTMIGEKVASWTGQKGVEIAADVATKTAAQTAAQTAATSTAALGGQGAAYAASSSVNAGTQLALAEGSYGASAGGGAAAGGGLSLASAGVGGIYATAAMIALKIAMGNPQSLAQKKRDQLNAGGITPGDIVGAGATDQLTMFSKALRTDVTPALADATIGSYNAGSGLLVLGKRTEEFVRTGADGQGKLVDAMTYDTWRWDALSQAWKTVNSPIDGLVDRLHRLAPATDEAAIAAANMIAAQAGFPDLADEILTIYNDQRTGMAQLAGEHKTLAQAIGLSSTRAHNASAIAWRLSEAVDSAAGAADTAAGAELRRSGSLRSSVEAINSATSNMNAQRAATESLATSSGEAAQRIGQAAGDIGGAARRIGGLLGRAATYSDPLFHGNADGAIFKYHAVGGVMTQPTVFHIGGEAGSEAILPLHRGPQTLEFIDKKIDALLSNSGVDDEMRAILVAVATYTKKSADILKRFEYIGIPISKREAVA